METAKLLGKVCRKMSAVDGTISKDEMARAVTLAKVNEIDVDAFIAGWNGESDDPSELLPLLKNFTKEEDRDMAFFFCLRMACADNVLSVKEVARLFTLAEVWDWAPAYVVLRIVELMRKEPEMKIDGLDK